MSQTGPRLAVICVFQSDRSRFRLNRALNDYINMDSPVIRLLWNMPYGIGINVFAVPEQVGGGLVLLL
ncbi:hypothetical protein TWF506_007615 [Arthrobotrys conoides]|uniref:Uncharacterized protein n=1 Tax=Arthrobotrys conoides TaxID=74498 RepID=A0AAN8NEW4_9PEZI